MLRRWPQTGRPAYSWRRRWARARATRAVRGRRCRRRHLAAPAAHRLIRSQASARGCGTLPAPAAPCCAADPHPSTTLFVSHSRSASTTAARSCPPLEGSRPCIAQHASGAPACSCSTQATNCAEWAARSSGVGGIPPGQAWPSRRRGVDWNEESGMRPGG